MDPRIRSRRILVMRAEGRRRRRWLLMVVGTVACLACAWGVSRTQFLDVDRIVVQGLTGADRIAVLHAAELDRGLSMIDIDSGYAAMAIEALPWVASADVRRRWPSMIEVDVEPRVPVAVTPGGAGLIALVDAYGYVIGRQSETDERRPVDILAPGSLRSVPVDGLPLIAVPFKGQVGEVHRDAGAGLSVVAALPDDLRPWVEAVTVTSEWGVGLALVGGASVTFSEADMLDHKIVALRSMLAGVKLDCIVSMNIIMADLTTVNRHQDCPVP